MLVLVRLQRWIRHPEAAAVVRAVGIRLEQERGVTQLSRDFDLVLLSDQMLGETKRHLYWILGAVVLLALTACANVSSVVLVRAVAARRQDAIRLALGARCAHLVVRTLCETVVLSSVGGLCGLVGGIWGVRWMISRFGQDLSIARLSEAGLDHVTLAVILLFAFLAGVFSSIPAVLALTRWARRSVILATELHGSESKARYLAIHPRRLLAATQIGLSMLLLLGAAWLAGGLRKLQQQSLGYVYKDVVAMDVSVLFGSGLNLMQCGEFFESLVAYSQKLPGVESAAAVDTLPVHTGSLTVLTRVGERDLGPDARMRQPIQLLYITPAYFRTLRLSLVRGGLITNPRWRGHSAVVSESLARFYWPGLDPVGRSFSTRSPAREYTVTGVVQDTRRSYFATSATPTVYTCEPINWMYLVLRSSRDPELLGKEVKDYVRTVSKHISVGPPVTIEQFINRSTARPRLEAILVQAFSLAALLLSACGVYGLASSVVLRRTREFAIRVAVGARPGEVMLSALSSELLIALGGIALGAGAFFALQRYLRNVFYGLDPIDPLAFFTASVVTLLAVLFAAYIPARRATHLDPAVLLRAE